MVFGQYARILVDMDLLERIFNKILVERDDFAFYVAVSYEKQPLFFAPIVSESVTQSTFARR